MSLAGGRVLVVEDESLVAMMTEAFLEDLGYEIAASAARLEEALGLAGTLDIDLAVLDVNLDGVLSYPVALALRDRGVPFFFTTGYGAAALPEALRGTLVLPKPFNQQGLAEAIRGIVSVGSNKA